MSDEQGYRAGCGRCKARFAKPEKRARKAKRIFSGAASHDLWVLIGRVYSIDAENALNKLACSCQELEARVEKLERSK